MPNTQISNTELPPLDISPVHVQITIHSERGHYTAYVIADMDIPTPISIPLKPDDVKNLNRLLQKAIQVVANNFGKGNTFETALGELAYIGNYAFLQIFSNPDDQQTIRDAFKAGTIVQIVSRDFFIPWELLYDGPLGAKAAIGYYWGMNHIISRAIMQDKRRGAYIPTMIASERPKVGLITSDRLPFVEKQEIPALKNLHRNKQIQLTPLRTLISSQRSTELVYLGSFLNKKLHILHFACHAYEQEPVEQSYLYITKDFAISMIDFVVSQYQLKHNPFVILNACLTGVINPLYTSSWAQKLWEHGARGVLATDFRVPDWFGAAFSEELYRNLLSGMPIGETLLTARRKFWNEQHNPLGLAYALYSSPSIRFGREK